MNLELVEKGLKRGLRGRHIHMDPFKSLEGLTSETASKIPPRGIHSCWDILFHIVYWQDLMLVAIRGEKVEWPRDNEQSWPSKEIIENPDNWTKLVKRFEEGIIEAEGYTSKIDSFEALPAWPNTPRVIALMLLSQHNAFHLGEIVATRQGLGFWPPPDYKTTF